MACGGGSAPSTMPPEQFVEALRSPYADQLWSAVEAYIARSSSADRMLAVKDEMGMKGYWYTRGHIKGQREIVKFVGKARAVLKTDAGVAGEHPGEARRVP